MYLNGSHSHKARLFYTKVTLRVRKLHEALLETTVRVGSLISDPNSLSWLSTYANNHKPTITLSLRLARGVVGGRSVLIS